MLAICNGSVTVATLCVSICRFGADECLITIKLLMPFHIFLRFVYNNYVCFFISIERRLLHVYFVGALQSS